MINSQKLFILVLVLNFVMGLSTQIYIHTDEFTESTLNLYDTENQIYEDTVGSLKASNETGYYIQGQYEASPINNVKLGRTILSLVWKGLTPIPVDADMTTTLTEKLILKTVKYFQALLYCILTIEIFFIWKNRKAT